MNRRDFLKILGASSAALLQPAWAMAPAQTATGGKRRILILVELKGGNDGLNTLVPYAQKEYYQYRPELAIPESTLLKLDSKVGMHPSLQALHTYWKEGRMAWIQGLGYANQNRSHFRSIDIWDTAVADDETFHTGWITQNLRFEPLNGIAVSTNLGPLSGDDFSSIGISSNPQQFARQGETIQALYSNTHNEALRHILDIQSSVDSLAELVMQYLRHAPTPKIEFGNDKFSRDLKAVYTLIASGMETPVYKVTLEGFDTHVIQPPKHQKKLENLALSLATLAENLQAAGCWDETLIMTYSEFGRRARENANKGTDHGAASVHFALGGKVKGGFHGEYPSLTELDNRGDIIYSTDFRNLYAAVLKNWWGINSNLGQPLNFV